MLEQNKYHAFKVKHRQNIEFLNEILFDSYLPL